MSRHDQADLCDAQAAGGVLPEGARHAAAVWHHRRYHGHSGRHFPLLPEKERAVEIQRLA